MDYRNSNGCDNHIMKLAEKACTAKNLNLSDNYLQLTNKLMRTFILQLDALKKYRTGGKQRIIVEHVDVNSGGKAIVGNVHQGGKRGSEI